MSSELAVDGHSGFVASDAHADVAAVVVTYNSASDIGQLIEDLRLVAADRPLRLVVVDNASSDDTVDIVRRYPDVKLVSAGGNIGYSGGINVGLQHVTPCDSILFLNPDLRLAPDAVSRMVDTINDGRAGAVVPLMLEEDGSRSPSIRREPSLTRALGDALLGSKLRLWPTVLSEVDHRGDNYREARDVDWATGAALLVSAATVAEIGPWDEAFFLYSEETDYFRRIRESGRTIRFEPSAVVTHRKGGSGASQDLYVLMAVNRVRYVEKYHGVAYSFFYRLLVGLRELARSYDPIHRAALRAVLTRKSWQFLLQAPKLVVKKPLSGSHRRGTVIVPACNEAAVIERTLRPLSDAAVQGFIELIVVCNGCSDNTSDVARGIDGVTVLELPVGSKPAALNAGDGLATLWPRLYLDADIQITASAVLDVLDHLSTGDVLVARPRSTYDVAEASRFVRAYYRARQRIPMNSTAMFGAGAYGLSESGHARLNTFPVKTGDDLYVDRLFAASEKAVVETEPSVVTTPRSLTGLLAILKRSQRTRAELLADNEPGVAPPPSRTSTALAIVRSVRGVRSGLDALVYLAIAAATPRGLAVATTWERDESSR